MRIEATGQTFPAPGTKIEWPIPWELPNDDPEDPEGKKFGDKFDESYSPNDQDHMFVLDAPGMGVGPDKDDTDKKWVRQNFYQFARVSFKEEPEKEFLLGSICSDRDRGKYHNQATLVWDPEALRADGVTKGKWVRTGAMENEVGLDHLVINEGG